MLIWKPSATKMKLTEAELASHGAALMIANVNMEEDCKLNSSARQKIKINLKTKILTAN